KYDHEPRSRRMMATGLSYLGHGQPPLHRFRLGLEFMLSGHREVDGMVESHSHIARMLGEQLGLPETVLSSLASSYERWDGRGWAGDLKGEAGPLPARTSQCAEFVEVATRLGGADAAVKLARGRRGKQFDPQVADVLVGEPAVLPAPTETSSWSDVIEPGLGGVPEEDQFEAALAAIATFVDLKSPYFLGHARAVADLAAEAAAGAGLRAGGGRLLLA